MTNSTSIVSIASVELGDAEIENVITVLKSGYLCQGKYTQQLEQKFAEKVQAKHAIAVSSGTAALHIAYLATVAENSEVIVPAFSHISTASMVFFANAKPVFADLNPKTYLIDIEQIKQKITPRTKAIAPVHLFGNACDIDAISALAKQNHLKIIWDAAQAHRTAYKNKDIGQFADAVTYSFYPTKNMTTGEGGMITTNDDQIAEQCRLLRSHGQTEKYWHPSIGLNYRMTDIQAAIGLAQLDKLDGFTARRRENAAYLSECLSQFSSITPQQVGEHATHSYHQYTITIDPKSLGMNRDEFSKKLNEQGIQTAVHYPRALHQQPAMIERLGQSSLPVAESLCSQVLSLPVHPGVSRTDLDKVVQAISKVLK